MSFQGNPTGVEQVVLPSVRDLGDFDVRRALPTAQRRMVGPFAFFDAFGPVVIRPGEGVDTRPHPHIGLATLTYLIEGEMVHRDSEGFVQTIHPGEVNLMTAGRGIVHSERSPSEFRKTGGEMFGFQSWLALPQALEETTPAFDHVKASDLPEMREDGAHLRLLAGDFAGLRAPTPIFSDTFYADAVLERGGRLKIASDHVERAFYVVEGSVEVAGQTGAFAKDNLVVLKPGAEVILFSPAGARLMLLGGEPLDGPRHVYWNFVSSRRERIDHAARQWRDRAFPGIPGESEFIPLPDSYRPLAA
ncbi:pirin family protein [Sphingomonas sp. OTU376]|uniref:pirin family protein n=1 Tax=Sphingomonas sp. OTU376 TaxID=3043863 RepID=UPI00313A8B73